MSYIQLSQAHFSCENKHRQRLTPRVEGEPFIITQPINPQTFSVQELPPVREVLPLIDALLRVTNREHTTAKSMEVARLFLYIGLKKL